MEQAGWSGQPSDEQRFFDLATGGQLVIWALRHLADAVERGRPVPPCVWQSFAVANLRDAYRSLCVIVTMVEPDDPGQCAFGQPNSPQLTTEENRLAELFHSLLRNDPACARAIAAGLARTESREFLFLSACRLARELGAAGHGFRAPRARPSRQRYTSSDGTAFSIQ